MIPCRETPLHSARRQINFSIPLVAQQPERVHGQASPGRAAELSIDRDDSQLDIRRSHSPQCLRYKQILLAEETDDDYYDDDIEPADEGITCKR